jgi:hypothetical protein
MMPMTTKHAKTMSVVTGLLSAALVRFMTPPYGFRSRAE